ncbi:hypothetical protein VB712_19460 [Spirulina sp. CCNP1310]|uniref:hypothetical protein n=1 Tax=Spirulina sp. CCNP1310 TaxID=3110249 RepID=UPI002B218455|nr:hypothetical protein [Spirulina sp. CCNP1310]MEA5421408.1 hypothetical protein [Spirulina sp. CCNP1310]
MFSIDVIIKHSPMPISVQRKEKEAAEGLYHEIRNAMQSQTPILVELTCEKQTDKRVTVLSDQISAVAFSEKTASTAGRVAGFLGLEPSDA